MADLTPVILDDAGKPLASSGDGNSSTGRGLAEVIAADQYLKGVAAVSGPNPRGGPRSGWGAARIAKAIPPGAAFDGPSTPGAAT